MRKETIMETHIYSERQIRLEVDFHRAENPNGVSILYFHGGGLMYGSRKDIDRETLERFLAEGYHVFSYDYRLAPESHLEQIYEDAVEGVLWFLGSAGKLGVLSTDYVLFGRSAGAYLSLLLSIEGRILVKPRAVLAYYGYAFLTPGWYEGKSPYYNSFPEITEEIASTYIGKTEISQGNVHRRYPLYIHARQSGRWLELLLGESSTDFIDRFTLLDPRKMLKMPRVFLCHSLQDPDVPFVESLALHHSLPGSRLYSCAIPKHEIDMDPVEKKQILRETFGFLERTLHTDEPL
jgi:acetyl esterase/lipase